MINIGGDQPYIVVDKDALNKAAGTKIEEVGI
jgi:hypothetical protein